MIQWLTGSLRLACCPQVSVVLASAPAGVWAQDEVAAVKSPQLSGKPFPGALGPGPEGRGPEAAPNL